MRGIVLPLVCAFALAGCVPEPLADYRPVVDPARTSPAKYEKDRQECVAIAQQVQADYQKKANEQLVAGLVFGAIMGAAIGSAVGGNAESTRYGAAAGALGGAASTEYTNDLVKYGPRRVVDRCMEGRGHNILADPGRSPT